VISHFAASSSAAIRILLVDDFEPWRQLVRSMLKPCQQLFMVEEALDGQAAVQRAKERRPDLILLDIGLPTMNGVEAAKRLSQVAPGAKVLFLSQNDDADVVRAAMSNGAQGYVWKTDAGQELLPAIEAVLRGEKFVSSRLRSVAFLLAA
jgi:DNA-binding NarL/FixJ family response regulator